MAFAAALISFAVFCLKSAGAAENLAMDRPVRAAHVVVRGLSVVESQRLIDLIAISGFNTLILDARDNVRFKNFPGKVRDNAWSIDEYVQVINYAKERHLDVIPEIKLLTHQKQLFGVAHQELMFDKETYNPNNGAVYDLLYRYLDEILGLVHPSAMHIGHDEVNGVYWAKGVLGIGVSMLPAELYHKDIMLLHGYLSRKGVKTWMWGDMLISMTELPMMAPYHLNGVNGYGANVRKILPNDIVICDWHYTDEQNIFPSIDLFRKEGFVVLGATFRNKKTIENFSRYASKQGAAGMIATTWFIPGHSSKKVVNTWAEVKDIIVEAGAIFNRYFPDEQ